MRERLCRRTHHIVLGEVAATVNHGREIRAVDPVVTSTLVDGGTFGAAHGGACRHVVLIIRPLCARRVVREQSSVIEVSTVHQLDT